MANKAQIQKWIDDYGEDHDFVRVRVRGVFPRAGSLQFIAADLVSRAMGRQAEGYQAFSKVIGVDVARHGNDQSVVTRRQGNHVWPQKRYRIADLMDRVLTSDGTQPTYPPYNIEQTGPSSLRITLAVAGAAHRQLVGRIP